MHVSIVVQVLAVVVKVDVEPNLIYIYTDSRIKMSKSDVVELLLFLQWLLIYKQVTVDMVLIWGCLGLAVIVSTVGVKEFTSGKFLIVY